MMFFLFVVGVARGLKAPLVSNVPGSFYVDDSCIDCDTCRWMAPDIFGRAQGQSYVAKQPSTSKEEELASLAASACPTGSIRAREKIPKVKFPIAIDSDRIPNVYHVGHHSEKSFGATPYLVGNVFVDSARYNSKLAKEIEGKVGQPEYMLLTHVDDVSDHAKWKERFPDMKRVIHRADARGPDQWPYTDLTQCEVIIDGDTEIAEGIRAIHVPGHSKGSVAYLLDGTRTGSGEGVIFTGDHLALSGRLARLDGMGRYGHDLQEQADSIDKLADLDFLHVLPGHGRRISFDNAHQRKIAIHHAALKFKVDPLGKEEEDELLEDVVPQLSGLKRPLWIEPQSAR